MEQKVKVHSKVLMPGELNLSKYLSLEEGEMIKQISSSCCINSADQLVVTITYLVEKENSEE